MRNLIIVAAIAMAAPLGALAQSDNVPPDTDESKALLDCISRNAQLLYRAPDAASEVAQAVVSSCELQRRAMLKSVKATPVQVEEFEAYLRRTAQKQVIFERAARAILQDR